MPYSFPPSRKLWWEFSELVRFLKVGKGKLYWAYLHADFPVYKAGRLMFVSHTEARTWFRDNGFPSFAKRMKVKVRA